MKINELKKALKGVDIVQTTPFNKNGRLVGGSCREEDDLVTQ